MKLLVLFGSTYICEQTFSTVNINKTKLRSNLTDVHLQSLLRISTSNMQPDFKQLVNSFDRPQMSHWLHIINSLCIFRSLNLVKFKLYVKDDFLLYFLHMRINMWFTLAYRSQLFSHIFCPKTRVRPISEYIR